MSVGRPYWGDLIVSWSHAIEFAVGSGVQGLVQAGLGWEDRSSLDKALDFTQHQLPASKWSKCLWQPVAFDINHSDFGCPNFCEFNFSKAVRTILWKRQNLHYYCWQWVIIWGWRCHPVVVCFFQKRIIAILRNFLKIWTPHPMWTIVSSAP